ncbi:phosphate metabolism protein 7 [Recurvomyces mirabilis]|nr:phosphate metabolism protein 7 [Recurvomyces mirabilis]
MDVLRSTQTNVLLPRASPQQQGSHRQQGSSISSLLWTLVPVILGATVIFLAFLVLRKKLIRVYAPRTYLQVLDKHEQTPRQSGGWFGFAAEYRRLNDDYVLGHSSLDNFLFLRLFKILVTISFVGCLITWPILFPVNATGGGGESGLDILSFSNVNNANRYYAHCFVAWIFLAFVMFMISRESLFYAYLRQAYLMSPYSTSLMSSKTVLFTDVPEEYRDEHRLRQGFQDVRHIWLAHDPSSLEDMVEDRDDAADKLETGELELIKGYIKKRSKKGDNAEWVEEGRQNSHAAGIHIEQKERPTHRTKPIIGKKVDTIDWARGELKHLIPKVAQEQAVQRGGKAEKISAVFIEFTTVRAAQSAFQQIAHQTPYRLTAKDVGMKPDMVLWKNIGKPWWLVKLLAGGFSAVIVLACLFWTIPVAFIGVLTNVDYLTNKLPWLSFIDRIPQTVLGLITGLLPVLLLAILMKLVPIFCQLFAKQFEPTLGAVQLRTQSWYFGFEVIQVFLITTFSSGAASVATQVVQQPTQAPLLLAKNLPKASNFYISYFILFGLMTAAMQLLNIVPLLFALVLGKILDKTPRKMYNRYVSLSGIGWGTFYPKYTNLGVIVLGFATVGFGILYLAFRYNVLFTLGTQVDTKGRAYAKALQQLTVGIYLSEVCMIGLFAIGTSGNTAGVGPLILMIIFTIGTVVWHFQLRSAMSKHTIALPNDLLAEEYRSPGDREADHERGFSDQESDDVAKKGESSSYDSAHQSPRSEAPPEPPKGIVGKIKAFLFPSKFASAAVISKHILSPHLSQAVRPYSDQEREEAYMHPAVLAETPAIWLARDKFGLSQQEVSTTREALGRDVIVTDEGVSFDDKGKLHWDEQDVRKAPLWEGKVDY